MKRQRWTPPLVLGALGLLVSPMTGLSQQQQQEPQQQRSRFDSRETLKQYYQQEFEKLNQRRIADLTELAGRLEEAEAELAYQNALNYALAFEQFEEGEKAADAYLQREQGDAQTRGLATFIKALALADREEHPEALQLLEAYMQEPGGEDQPQFSQSRAFTVGEAFLQRLVDSNLYDTAREVANLLAQSDDSEVRSYFEGRRERLGMLGKPAPPIQAQDIDGEVVNLNQMQGKVVLVSFWASWAPPSMSLFSQLKALRQEYGDRFEILGVNVDQAREGVDAEEAESIVRRFLVDFRVGWPNIVEGAEEAIEAYGVQEIPANFLIDEDGRVSNVELSGSNLERAVREALGNGEEAEAQAAPEAPAASRQP